MKHDSFIELLEARIAPAGVMVNDLAKMATWTDFDGDKVTLKWTTKAPAFETTDQGEGVRIDRINLTAADNSNESFTLTVKAGPHGDGHLDLGRISAKGVPLKSWSSPAASLLEIDCGNGTNGIGSLTIGALGALGSKSFAANGASGFSEIDGATSTVKIQGDVYQAGLTLMNVGKMKSLSVSGSLRATDDPNSVASGFLAISGTSIRTVSVGGSVIGGSALGDGQLSVACPVEVLAIKGSIVGGTAPISGFVSALAKVVSVGGNIQGGATDKSGYLDLGSVKSVTIGGSIIGGQEGSSGILKVSSAGTILVKGNVMGGLQTAAAQSGASGAILADQHVVSLKIGGDLVAGTYASGNQLGYNGAVIVRGNLGSLTVTGSIQGNSGTEAIVLVRGEAPAAPGDYSAIGRVIVGGSVSFGYLAAGQDANYSGFSQRIGAAENPDAGIGSVRIGGDWFHSNLTAGVDDVSSNGFSSTDTHGPGAAARQAAIGVIAIKGYVLDDPNLPKVSGFGANQIARIVAHGVKLFQSGDAGRSLDAAGFVDVKEFV